MCAKECLAQLFCKIKVIEKAFRLFTTTIMWREPKGQTNDRYFFLNDVHDLSEKK